MTMDPQRVKSLQAGLKLASPEQGEGVVISGVAGRFPDSDDIYHFRDNLFNKVDLVSDDDRRWKKTNHEIPQRTGKINKISKFDAGFYGMNKKQADIMDPMCRNLLERTYEAIVDAGLNPHELKGTNTGVFVGLSSTETEEKAYWNHFVAQSFSILGCTKSMMAQRISYWFGLNGPSFITDTACSSSLFALETAYRYLREGKCEMAIVGGSNLCLHPSVSLQFSRLGVLSADGTCKSFDESGDGYARSEGICVIILQKTKYAKRIYAKVLHSKTNCDGYKENGITYPSGKCQGDLFRDFYEECKILPNTLSFIEAHGTGTKVGDPEELNTLDEIFCTGRDEPLLIGSVKSNIGHNEPVSGLCSLVKVLIGMETGFIPPNLHFKTPRIGVKGLEEGRMKVVTEETLLPFDPVRIGINGFGFGGANSHLLLEWNMKNKINHGLPNDDLPRLVCFSARTQEGIETIIKDLSNQTLDCEYIGLFHNIFRFNLVEHFYRGYMTISKRGVLNTSFNYCECPNFPLYISFGGWTKETSKMGMHLLKIPIFAAHIQRVHDIFTKNILDINIVKIISDTTQESKLSRVIGTIAIQTGLIEIFNSLNLNPSQIFGSSIGEISRAYMDGSIDLKETLFIAFNYANNSVKQDLNFGGRLKKTNVGLEHTRTIILPKGKSLLLQIGGAKINTQHKTKCFEVFSDASLGLPKFLEVLGKIYESGFNLTVSSLYENVKWPVARSTPMISPLIKWDYSKDYFVAKYTTQPSSNRRIRSVKVSVQTEAWKYIKGHVINGRLFFPATGYLVSIWKTLATIIGKSPNDMKVVFENVKFLRACTFSISSIIYLIITIDKGNGNFEVVEGDTPLVTGRIYEDENIDQQWIDLPVLQNEKDEVPLIKNDIYKEFRLRGYNYKDQFKAIKNCNLTVTKATVEWTENFTTFMDNLLQLHILNFDSRSLFVPTRIDKLLIDAPEHIKYVQNLGDKTALPVNIYKDLSTIRSGGIEIKGLHVSNISKRKIIEPVLEVYKFVPNETELSLDVSVRILMQIAIENEPMIKIKAVELIDEETEADCEYLSPLILQALTDQPLIQPDLTIMTKTEILLPGINVEDRKISNERDLYCVVGSRLLERSELRLSIFLTLKEGGFIISRENIHCSPNKNQCEGIDIICIHTTPKEKLILMRQSTYTKKQVAIAMKESVDYWLKEIQNVLNEDNVDIILHCQDDEQSGILGFTNCVRREPNGNKVRCVFIQDALPEFQLENELFQQQLLKNLAVNVFKDGCWGTYRHLLLKNYAQVKSEHCYVNVSTKGDLSSLNWFEGRLNTNSVLPNEEVLAHVYYASINFRDIMTASGRIQNETITKNRLEQDCVLGFEFSGRDKNGKRIMGMTRFKAMATLVSADINLLWDVPDHWSLEDAATVPTVYGTVLYALIQRGELKRGQSILIHSGTGGVGQAAINVALHYGCTIYVTVGNENKREFIKNNFPQIQPAKIGNSRDVTFEQQILKETSGRGVEIILNSLADDKLQTSVRCLAYGGKFIEIGKFDLQSDTLLSTDLAEKGCSFIGVILDLMFDSTPRVKHLLVDLISVGVSEGYVKPLPRTCFVSSELEEAFRYMATGKHIGKVVLRIKEEEVQKIYPPQPILYNAVPRFSCNPDLCYVIIGGLGGFGLELADWLVVRGATKLVLVSRKGLSTSYQHFRMNAWKSYGVKVLVQQENVVNLKGAESLICKANNLGPVGAIFNLAVILKDAILQNQTAETFAESCDPKAVATKNLDIISRKLCPQLQHFVVFSSVSCGRGNAGQTNYGFSNSIMERICENRHKRGLPALAIQWGAIGDVGLVAELQEEHKDLVIGGTLQQKISSCLEVLDKLLKQGYPIVGSMVVAEKRSSAEVAGNMLDAVVNILGLRDLKTVSLHSTLSELGMDSMMAVEIKQMLEREYDVFLSPQDLRNLTFSRLQEISLIKIEGTEEAVEKNDNDSSDYNLMRIIANEDQSDLCLIKMSTAVSDDLEAETVFMIPGIDGTSTVFEPLAKNLQVHAKCVQFSCIYPEDNIQEMASNIFCLMRDQLITGKKFTILAHSFGAIVGLELTALLEKSGFKGTLVTLDGSPTFLKKVLEKHLDFTNEDLFHTSFVCFVLSFYLPTDVINTYKPELIKCDSNNSRMEMAINMLPKSVPHSRDHLRNVMVASYQRIKGGYNYKQSFDKLESPVYLYRPINPSIKSSGDYDLSSFTKTKVQVKVFKGTHISIMENIHLSNEINNIVKECKEIQ